MSTPSLQVGREERFERFESIEWWNQDLLRSSKVLIIGAGAIGNEVIKNLALLGIGSIAIVDIDRIELSNLTRSVLFRAEDRGKFKAECAARAAKEIYPGLNATSFTGNILSELGLGAFLWADVVLGAVDNREARLFINSACARLGKTWFDGGIEVLNGIVRGFSPPATACYECLMSERDWEVVNQRRSCSLLAARAEQHQGVPTTPTTASVIGAIEAQETVKFLHKMEYLSGSGFVFEGTTHSSYRSGYGISPDCPWHEEKAEIRVRPEWSSDTRLREIWEDAAGILNGIDALDLSRELIESLECRACKRQTPVFSPPERAVGMSMNCESCEAPLSPRFIHSIGKREDLLEKTVSEIGLPKRDVLWARNGEKVIGFEIAGDPLFDTGRTDQ